MIPPNLYTCPDRDWETIYLEHYLNDLYDPNNRGIYISEDQLILPDYLYVNTQKVVPFPPQPTDLTLYNEADGQPAFYLYNSEDYYFQSHFIINVPSSIPLTDTIKNRISVSTNRYKQAGSIYSIVSY